MEAIDNVACPVSIFIVLAAKGCAPKLARQSIAGTPAEYGRRPVSGKHAQPLKPVELIQAVRA